MTSQGTLLHPEGRNDKPETPPDGIPHRAVLLRILFCILLCRIKCRAQADERILIGGGHQLAGGVHREERHADIGRGMASSDEAIEPTVLPPGRSARFM